MSDITMCTNKKCKLRKTCYRFMAKPDRWQSYAEFKPVRGKCEYYYPMVEKVK